MRVAVITYTFGQNYGALLQAYALADFLKQRGHDCKDIDYRRFDNRRFKPRKNLHDIFHSICHFKENVKRIDRYIDFRNKYFKLTPTCLTEGDCKKLNSQFDAFITGSDQVWNCQIEVCREFFLAFVADSKKKISYAASFGTTNMQPETKNEVKGHLESFDAISVRERSAQEFLLSEMGIQSEVVLDPVFLKTKDEWSSILQQRIEKKPYCFVYCTQDNPRVAEVIKQYNRQGYDVITPYALRGIKCKIRKDIGPLEFLNYICHAEFVVTTSFHATAFCTIFEKDFWVVPHNQTGSRVTNFLSEIGLEDRVVVGEHPLTNSDIDYTSVRDKIENARLSSIHFLDRALRGE